MICYFKKQKDANINIRLVAVDSGLDYTPEDIFLSSQNVMHYFTMKFNIIPFK